MPISRRTFLKYSAGVAGVSVAMATGAAGFVSLQNESDESVIERVQVPVKNLKPATILMSHEPDPADAYSLDGRVSLQLSGHSHGGQIRLPGKGALILPWLGEKYDQGLYQVNDMWLYTTRGVGVVVTPIRLNCPPEVTAITLVGA